MARGHSLGTQPRDMAQGHGPRARPGDTAWEHGLGTATEGQAGGQRRPRVQCRDPGGRQELQAMTSRNSPLLLHSLPLASVGNGSSDSPHLLTANDEQGSG